jgi:hypothetical protein
LHATTNKEQANNRATGKKNRLEHGFMRKELGLTPEQFRNADYCYKAQHALASNMNEM